MYLGTFFLYIAISFAFCVVFKYHCSFKQIERKAHFSRERWFQRRYKRSLLLVILFAVFLVFIAVFRLVDYGYGGTDAIYYVNSFNSVPSISYVIKSNSSLSDLFSKQEPLFLIYESIIKKGFNDYHYFFLFTYSIIVISFFKTIITLYHSNNISYAPLILMLYPFVHSFNVLRGWLSIALCLFSMLAFWNGRRFFSLLLIMCAGLFHYIAFSFLLVWVFFFVDDISPKLFSRKVILIAIIAMNVLCLLYRTVVFSFLGGTKYAYYFSFIPDSIPVGFFPYIVICALGVYFLPDISEKGNNARKSVIMLAINLGLMYVIVFFDAWRINDFFWIPRMYVLSEIYGVVKKRAKGIIREVIIIGLTVFLLLSFYLALDSLYERSGVFPYLLSIRLR